MDKISVGQEKLFVNVLFRRLNLKKTLSPLLSGCVYGGVFCIGGGKFMMKVGLSGVDVEI
jgi:hypothetical protein